MPKKTNLCGVMICLTLTLMINTQIKAGDLGLENIDVTAPVSKYSNSYSGSATKTNTKLIDLPQSVNVINQEQLKDQQATSLGQSITLRQELISIKVRGTVMPLLSEVIKPQQIYFWTVLRMMLNTIEIFTTLRGLMC